MVGYLDFGIKVRKPREPLIWPLIKVSVTWFLLALVISIEGPAFGLSQSLQRNATLGLFVVSGLCTVLRVGASHGSSWRFWVSAILLTSAGAEILAIQPHTRSVNSDPFLEKLKTFDQSVEAFTVGAQTAFATSQPNLHLSSAVKLIFLGATELDLAAAREHLNTIPAMAREYPSAEALRKIADVRLYDMQHKVARRPGDSAKPVSPLEVVETRKTENGWSVTLRNVDANSIGNIRYRMSYFTASGERISAQAESYSLGTVLRPHETRTLNIEEQLVSDAAPYAFFTLVSWQVSPTTPSYSSALE